MDQRPWERVTEMSLHRSASVGAEIDVPYYKRASVDGRSLWTDPDPDGWARNQGRISFFADWDFLPGWGFEKPEKQTATHVILWDGPDVLGCIQLDRPSEVGAFGVESYLGKGDLSVRATPCQ